MKLTNLFEQRPTIELEPPTDQAAAAKGATEPPVEPQPQPGGQPAPPGGEQAGYVGVQDEYTLDMIVGQIRGITKPWMNMASRFPEGEQRHNFMEIGERLTEIANTLERDFN